MGKKKKAAKAIFEVLARVDGIVSFTVEAKNEKEAKAMVTEQWYNQLGELEDVSSLSVIEAVSLGSPDDC